MHVPYCISRGRKKYSDNFFLPFCFRSPLGYVRKRHAYRTQLVEPVPAQVSDLKISHGKLVKKMRGARGVYARYCPYQELRLVLYNTPTQPKYSLEYCRLHKGRNKTNLTVRLLNCAVYDTGAISEKGHTIGSTNRRTHNPCASISQRGNSADYGQHQHQPAQHHGASSHANGELEARYWFL